MRGIDKPVIGVIGGIGSGKSAVAAMLAEQGGALIVADVLGHEVLRQADIVSAVVRRWGRDVLDSQGAIDRRRLAGIVFAEESQRRDLEALVHPWIRRRVEALIAAARLNHEVRFIVLDAAVLLEVGWEDICDKLVFVEADESVRHQRVVQRGWSLADLAARERAQMPLTRKAERADHVIVNNDSLDHLRPQIEELRYDWGLAIAPTRTVS